MPEGTQRTDDALLFSNAKPALRTPGTIFVTGVRESLINLDAWLTPRAGAASR
ncbi:hypothetical protein D3C87_2160010 [compost metagenome]